MPCLTLPCPAFLTGGFFVGWKEKERGIKMVIRRGARAESLFFFLFFFAFAIAPLAWLGWKGWRISVAPKRKKRRAYTSSRREGPEMRGGGNPPTIPTLTARPSIILSYLIHRRPSVCTCPSRTNEFVSSMARVLGSRTRFPPPAPCRRAENCRSSRTRADGTGCC